MTPVGRIIERATPVESLTVADLRSHPVWQYVNRDGGGETLVQPVRKIPVSSLTGRIVGAEVRFANGNQSWALIGNVDTGNARLTEHFLTLSIERGGRWFALARYHDQDIVQRGPEALARFLGLNVNEVFPISVDIRPYAKGDPATLIVSVRKEPRERLTRGEVIALAVP